MYCRRADGSVRGRLRCENKPGVCGRGPAHVASMRVLRCPTYCAQSTRRIILHGEGPREFGLQVNPPPLDEVIDRTQAAASQEGGTPHIAFEQRLSPCVYSVQLECLRVRGPGQEAPEHHP